MKPSSAPLLCLGLLCAIGSSCAAQESEPSPKPGGEPTLDTKGGQPEQRAAPQRYTYSPVGKRNPFQSTFEAMRPDDRRRRTLLERYELDQLRLVAVMSGTASPRAMVEDPAGRGHIVRIGTLVGRNGGQVSRIGRRHIAIHEEVRTPHGRFVHPVLLRLPADRLAQLEEL